MIRVNVRGSVGAWKAARGKVEREARLSFSFLFLCVCGSPEIPNSLNPLPRCVKGNLYNFRGWELREGQTIWYLNLPLSLRASSLCSPMFPHNEGLHPQFKTTKVTETWQFRPVRGRQGLTKTKFIVILKWALGPE